MHVDCELNPLNRKSAGVLEFLTDMQSADLGESSVIEQVLHNQEVHLCRLRFAWAFVLSGLLESQLIAPENLCQKGWALRLVSEGYRRKENNDRHWQIRTKTYSQSMQEQMSPWFVTRVWITLWQ